MLIKYNILHISGIKHTIIDDFISYRNSNGFEDIFIFSNFQLEINEILNNKKNIVVIFHFIDKIDVILLKSIINILNENNIIYGLYLHTFFPFCNNGTYINKEQTCNILNFNECNCDKYIRKNNYNYFVSDLDFIITQDIFSFNLVNKIKEYNNLSYKIIILKQFVKINEVLGIRIINPIQFNLGFVGTFSEIKGFYFLITFLKKNNYFLRRIGVNIYLFSLESEIDKYLGLGKDLKYLNYSNINIVYNQSNRKQIYSQIDCLIIPSIWNETGPMVLYEAFTNKIPVIVSDQKSLKEKVIDRVDSYVFKTGDERDLLKGILWMKKNYKKVISNKQGFKYNTIEKFNKQLNNFLNEL